MPVVSLRVQSFELRGDTWIQTLWECVSREASECSVFNELCWERWPGIDTCVVCRVHSPRWGLYSLYCREGHLWLVSWTGRLSVGLVAWESQDR